MTISAAYIENDVFAAKWLRELIKEGHITDGEVMDCSLEDIRPCDLERFTRVHLCAGIAVWDYALNEAGWGDDPVWTASLPCQPFSAAGKGLGFADERHLWPSTLWLVQQCRPHVLLGEQVASKDGLAWFELVSTDLEAEDYAVGAVDLCAAGFGSPHIRQRNYWCAVANDDQERQFQYAQRDGQPFGRSTRKAPCRDDLGGCSRFGDVVNAQSQQEGLPGRARLAGGSSDLEQGGESPRRRASGRPGKPHPFCDEGSCCHNPNECDGNVCWLLLHPERVQYSESYGWVERGSESGRGSAAGEGRTPSDERLANDNDQRWDGLKALAREAGRCEPENDSVLGHHHHHHHQGLAQRPFAAVEPGALRIEGSTLGETGLVRGRWSGADWIFCRDGKWRPVEPGTFPLATRYPNRVGLLRGYGNALCAPVAQGFIEAVMDVLNVV